MTEELDNLLKKAELALQGTDEELCKFARDNLHRIVILTLKDAVTSQEKIVELMRERNRLAGSVVKSLKNLSGLIRSAGGPPVKFGDNESLIPKEQAV